MIMFQLPGSTCQFPHLSENLPNLRGPITQNNYWNHAHFDRQTGNYFILFIYFFKVNEKAKPFFVLPAISGLDEYKVDHEFYFLRRTTRTTHQGRKDYVHLKCEDGKVDVMSRTEQFILEWFLVGPVNHQQICSLSLCP